MSDTTTSLQTGTTPNPFASNAQDFSGSDDEILDNFADWPLPGDPPPSGNTHDDGTPMGLGGEKGKQSEPASSTLEADIVNGTPGEKHPPEDSAGEPEPEQDASETGSEPEPISEEPETPEFPPVLLHMAGLTDASAAQAAGFKDPEALLAAIKWRGQLLTPGVQPAQPSAQGLYRRNGARSDPPLASRPAPETIVESEGSTKPFELPAEQMEVLDEDLQAVIRQMNDHYRQELDELRSSATKREADLARQQELEEEARFDQVVQSLGDDWKDVFGQGNGSELAQAGRYDPVAMTNYNHRALLFEAVEAVREVNAKQGYKPMTLDQEVQWALMQRYPDKFQQSISGKNSSSGKSGQREGVTASRPTQRKNPPQNQNDRTLSAVDAMLRKKHGYGLDRSEKDEFDGEI